MISLYSGTPGSGKSLHIAQRIVALARRSRPIVCNFPLDLTKIDKKHPEKINFIEVDNKNLNPELLVSISRKVFKDQKTIKENYILLVIDEAQIIYNSREWAKDPHRMEWLQFYSQHRKFGYEVVLVAQYDGMIDKQIRAMIEYNVIHRKASNFGMGGKFLSAVAGGHLFAAVKIWYPLGEKVGSEMFKSSKKYWQIYDSYKMFEKPEDNKKDPKKLLEMKEKQIKKLQIEIEELKEKIKETEIVVTELPQESEPNM